MFLAALEGCISGLLGEIYCVSMWPVFAVQFNFKFLIIDAGEQVQLITSYFYLLLVNPCVLSCVGKLYIRAFRGNLLCVNVASIYCEIQFRVFDH